MKIADFDGRFDNERVTIVSCGRTTADYQRAVQTQHVVLINYALNLVPLFPEQSLVHVSLHAEVFCSHPNLYLPNVTPVVGRWGTSAVPQEIDAKTVYYATRQFPDLDSEDLRNTARDRSMCVREGVLCHVANSSHCAIHLTWLLGCRDLCVVGATEFKGMPTPGYDERLCIPEAEAVQTTPATYYISSFRRFVGLLEWDDVTMLGY